MNIRDADAWMEAVPLETGIRRSPERLSVAAQAQVLSPVKAFLEAGRLADATAVLDRLRHDHPDSSLFACECAVLRETLGDRSRAVAILDRFARDHPADARSLGYMGTLRFLDGDEAAARDLLSRALARGPHDFFVRTNAHRLHHRPEGETPVGPSAGPFAVATSIPPGNVAESVRALASWARLGASVHSLNTGEEIERLRPHFDFVRFHESNDTAKAAQGRDYQSLAALLRTLSGLPFPVCGILNADILLDGEPEDWAAILDAASQSCVFGSRLDVEAPDRESGRVYERGFDFFFFPRELAAKIPALQYRLGLNWWDYGFPWLARQAGLPLTFCYSPVARHEVHPNRWDEQMFYDAGLYTARLMAPELAALLADSPTGHLHRDAFLTGLALSMASSLVGAATPLHCPSLAMGSVFAPPDPMRLAIDPLSTTLCRLPRANGR